MKRIVVHILASLFSAQINVHALPIVIPTFSGLSISANGSSVASGFGHGGPGGRVRVTLGKPANLEDLNATRVLSGPVVLPGGIHEVLRVEPDTSIVLASQSVEIRCKEDFAASSISHNDDQSPEAPTFVLKVGGKIENLLEINLDRKYQAASSSGLTGANIEIIADVGLLFFWNRRHRKRR